MDGAETQYVKSESGWVAYQVIGSGDRDVVVVKPMAFPIDLMREEPAISRYLNGLSAFCRHIWFDPRGTGASDSISEAEGRLIESYVDDMVAVIDAAGSDQVVVLGLTAAPALTFAATHPDRTRALVLFAPSARIRQADDYPIGIPDAVLDASTDAFREDWGTGESLRRITPSRSDDPSFTRWAARSERLSTTPEGGLWRQKMNWNIDVRHTLGAIRVPTLVINRTELVSLPHSRYVAEHIANARTIERPGDDYVFFAGDTKPELEAIEEFITGSIAEHDDDRVFATVMFTDVVRSTEQLVQHGDRRWQEKLESHDRIVRDEIRRSRGRPVNTTGDGFVATFDGPGRAIRCASAIRDGLLGLGIEVRIGLHAGEIEQRGGDIGGIVVVIAQRIQALAQPCEVLASSTLKDLVAGSDIPFKDRDVHQLKGVPDPMQLFAVAH